ncbi:hypothetical protein NDNC_0120 [Candidatus Nasuia deltocephalinicola]|uniref:30S ribosomal protein S9 n=1 Tax=Candidatus Nasuia deltocephalincola TaxID=1160784 RepID=A0A975A367_9PROT|nr:30S ribosomal protein S9 [Candidatus Nasuia deltocephalinicola]WKD87091.1 30S ribosomal protein S9 [Candidatus Nasuia deltocephalinicola]BEH03846.1 hypothetical protein NDNC_0120 [Candidatus Nasuia deltocephalinicola]
MKNIITVGKKKTSIAKIFLKKNLKKKIEIFINNKIKIKNYFNKKLNYKLILEPLKLLNIKNLNINIKLRGGGKSSQIIAIRSGISKAILLYDSKYKKQLSDKKLLTRDSRIVERKKFGKHKSRKSKQFSKR